MMSQRIVANECTQLGSAIIIDNRGGAGGVIAAELVARSIPNGYTIFFAYTTFTRSVSACSLIH